VSRLDYRAREAEIRQTSSRFDHLLDAAPDSDGLSRRGRPETIGQAVAESREWSDWAQRGAVGQFAARLDGLDLRAVTDVTLGTSGSGSTSGGALTRPERLGRVGQDFLDRRTFLIDELPVINVSAGNTEYVQDKAPLADLADAAREVAEGGVKPQAGVTFQVVNEAAAVIAAWVNMTRQVMADAPQLQSYIDNRLRYALKRRADKQVISGTGVAPNLLGLTNRSGILTYAPGGAEARYRSIRHAQRLMEDAEAMPEIIVLSPTDGEYFDLSNDTSAGLHAADADGGIRTAGASTAWGLRQVRSTAVAAGTALLIDPTGVALLDRQQITAYTTDSHGSNFTSNVTTLLVECRLGLALFNPASVCRVTFNGTI
jgi:HK97 family phage major capsid protein